MCAKIATQVNLSPIRTIQIKKYNGSPCIVHWYVWGQSILADPEMEPQTQQSYLENVTLLLHWFVSCNSFCQGPKQNEKVI
jgi:hypothetical protein